MPLSWLVDSNRPLDKSGLPSQTLAVPEVATWLKLRVFAATKPAQSAVGTTIGKASIPLSVGTAFRRRGRQSRTSPEISPRASALQEQRSLRFRSRRGVQEPQEHDGASRTSRHP